MVPDLAREVCDEQYFHWLDLGQIEKQKPEVVDTFNKVEEEDDEFKAQDIFPQEKSQEIFEEPQPEFEKEVERNNNDFQEERPQEQEMGTQNKENEGSASSQDWDQWGS